MFGYLFKSVTQQGRTGSNSNGLSSTTTAIHENRRKDANTASDDITANTLLSQFPQYGSYAQQQQQQQQQQSNLSSTTTNASISTNIQPEEDTNQENCHPPIISSCNDDTHNYDYSATSNENHTIILSPRLPNGSSDSNATTTKRRSNATSSGSTTNTSSNRSSSVLSEVNISSIWDREEMSLWKTDDSTTTNGNDRSEETSTNRRRRPISLEYLNEAQQNQKQWVVHGNNTSGTSSITATPTSASTSASVSNNIREEIEVDEEYDTTSNTSTISFRTSSNENTQLKQEEMDKKQHWMPDKLCKICYACEVPFTVFRRRHHCRNCGQVFCSNCSAYFVELAPSPFKNQAGVGRVGGGAGSRNTTMRACKMCYDQVFLLDASTPTTADGNAASCSNTNNVKEDNHTNTAMEEDAFTSVQTSNNSSSENKPVTEPTSNIHPSMKHILPSNLIEAPVQPTPEEENKDFRLSCGDTFKGKDFQLLSLTKQKLEDRAAAAQDLTESINRNSTTNAPHVSFSKRLSHVRQHFIPVQKRSMEDTSTTTSPGINSQQQPTVLSPSRNPNTMIPNLEVHVASSSNHSTSLATTSSTQPLARFMASLTPKNNTVTSKSSNTSASTTPESISNPNTPKQPQLPTTTTMPLSKQNTTPTQKPLDFSLHLQKCNQFLGSVAASYLESMGMELICSDASLLLQELGLSTLENSSASQTDLRTNENSVKNHPQLELWVDTLMMLATRACATITPNVKNGDLLDIRPYCKIKVISGGGQRQSAYMSGIIFRKNVSHKRMAREIINPRIMLLSGGIEYTRTENRIASLDTLLEQEEKYMEILVTKIFGLKPDVLLVGRSVSRQAQELLLHANVVLIQHVKSSLMGRIARQTGATILSSTDHVMNQFGTSVLGRCRRFRLVTFRDNEAWSDLCARRSTSTNTNTSNDKGQHTPPNDDTVIPNYERQALLAAHLIGDGVIDGKEAVRCGLAKRGVARTFIMLEGCPKQLGCTIVLRGASRPALKQLKKVLRFLINVAYNLKLETSYLRERRIKLPKDYTLLRNGNALPCYSSSLCVHFGNPPLGRKVRPWNGASSTKSDRSSSNSVSGPITACHHQAILITSVWMTEKTQCCTAEVKGICYYSSQDVSLGQFLRDSCFNLSLKCQNPSCKKSVLEHSLSFIHNDGLVNIMVEQMDDPLPPAPFVAKNSNTKDRNSQSGGAPSQGNMKHHHNPQVDNPIATWTFCTNCSKVVTPLVYISDDTWNFSFGKFLEVYFYNRDAILNSDTNVGCSCNMQTASVLYFGSGRLAARFTYEEIRPYNVYVRRNLPFDEQYHKEEALRQLDKISVESSALFVRFDKHMDRVSREARQLFGSAYNKPEHLQTVLSELNCIGSEVDHAAKILQEKIAAVTNKCHAVTHTAFAVETPAQDIIPKDVIIIDSKALTFPWHARRYLFLLTSSWNERLSAAGQALTAMKRQNVAHPIGSGDGTDEVFEGMRRLRQLSQVYSQYNIQDMTIPSFARSGPGSAGTSPHGYTRTLHRRHHSAQATLPHSHHPRNATANANACDRPPPVSDYDYHDFDDFADDIVDDFDDFAEMSEDDIDSDVVASRQRLQALSSTASTSSQSQSSLQQQQQQQQQYFPGNIQSAAGPTSYSNNAFHHSNPYDNTFPTSSQHMPNKSKATVTPGVVKSAITRFFNRGNKELDPYVVDLGTFIEGRPRLEPGVGGVVIPVYDDQHSTVIAYSLTSIEYESQFREYATTDVSPGASTNSVSSANSDSIDGSHYTSDRDNDHPYTTAQRGAKGSAAYASNGRKDIERRMLVRNKTHIKHTFRDLDVRNGQPTCKFICTTYWATQFHAVRQAFLSHSSNNTSVPDGQQQQQQHHHSYAGDNSDEFDFEDGYIRSLSSAHSWAASGGKSGASFSKTTDGRFVVKCISRTELQMFLDCAPAYFEYLSKAFFHGLPTVLCKIVGVYQIGYHNRVTGKRTMEQVAVMQNIFYERKISMIFDLKGSLRGRFAQQHTDKDMQNHSETSSSDAKSNEPSKLGAVKRKNTPEWMSSNDESDSDDYDEEDMSTESSEDEDSSSSDKSYKDKKDGCESSSEAGATLLDGDFLEFTTGRPLPLNDRAKAIFHMSILNDTLFLSIINVIDYSILVGIDEERMELVVGIIDFMRQYDILKQMERVGKSLPMVVGSEAPTIIQPPLYKARFTNAMERYFMTVPNKWTTI